ncbi:MAG: DUF4259 domain-containing protein [Deltaproteobacteria bacterium]|nr:DUF4259 domain-containing protein [Deltaproteobacteria bacterium]
MDARSRSHGFDNDGARTYFADFLADPSLDFIDDTFEFDNDDPDEAADALLAAELVAAAIGKPSPALPPEVRDAIKKAKGPNKKVLTRARTAVRAALDPASAIRKHWTEGGAEASVPAVTELLERLT